MDIPDLISATTCSDSSAAFTLLPFPFFPFLPLSLEGPHSSSSKSSAVTATGCLFSPSEASSTGGISFLAFFFSFLGLLELAFIAD